MTVRSLSSLVVLMLGMMHLSFLAFLSHGKSVESMYYNVGVLYWYVARLGSCSGKDSSVSWASADIAMSVKEAEVVSASSVIFIYKSVYPISMSIGEDQKIAGRLPRVFLFLEAK